MAPLLKRHFLLPFCLLVVAAGSSRAAEQTISLSQALERAVAGNLDLRRERVSIDIADARLLAAQGQFDVVLNGLVSFTRRPTPLRTAQDISAGLDNTVIVDVGVSRALETGGSLRLAMRNDIVITDTPVKCGTVGLMREFCTDYNSNLGLVFTHPLLRGFGTEVTLARVRRERINNDIALLNRQTRAANVLRDVLTGYWELAFATQDLAIRRSAVELAREQLRVTQAQIDVGRLAPVDRAAVERAIGDRQQEVVLAEQNVFFRSLQLLNLVGAPVDATSPALLAADAPLISPREIDVPFELQQALDRNPQLRSLRMGIQLSEIDIETALSTVRPRLDFEGSVGTTGRGSFQDTIEQTFGFENLTWSAGLRFELPVQNRTARGNARAAEASAEGARLDAASFELALRDLVLRLSSNVRTALQRVDLAKQTVGFAEQNLEAEKARFSVGRATNNDVLLRQQELKVAQIQIVRASVDVLASEAALAAVTGDVLERYGLVLKGL